MRKNIGILLLFYFINIQFGISQNQILNIPVTIKLSNSSVNKALDVLSHKTNYYFSYDSKIVNPQKRISINEKNKPLKDILKTIFSEDIDFSVINNHIIISKTRLNLNSPNANFPDSILQISGKIIDKRTNQPIPFASLGILNTNTGTVSNQNGEFNLKLPDIFLDSTVYFINLGYRNLTIPVRKVLNEKNKLIPLRQEYISIEEVIIRNSDPEQIILNALQNVKDNYSQKPVLLTAFYREAVKKNKTLFSYSETFSKIYKTPYKISLHSDQIKVLKSRKITNTGINDTLSFKLKNGLYSSLSIDFVKNTIDFFDENKMQDYDYRLSDIISYDNSTVYVISFEQKKNIKIPLYKGKLYVNNNNFAIIAAEFQYNLKLSNKNINFVVKKSRKFNITPVSVKYFVKYKKIQGKYIFNHVRADLIFKLKKKRNPFSVKYKTSFETIVLNYKIKNVLPFKKKEILKRNRIFIDNNYKYDASFWKNYNYLSPEKSITDALKEIRSKINALQ